MNTRGSSSGQHPSTGRNNYTPRGNGRGGRGRGRGGHSDHGNLNRGGHSDHSGFSRGGHNDHGGFNRGGRGRGGRGDHGSMHKPPGLVAVKPTGSTPVDSATWRVMYGAPAVTRPEVSTTGEQVPGPFSPPLRPVDGGEQNGIRRPQDILRKHNEAFVMKQRVQVLLQQAANSLSGGHGNYVGKLSHNNNPLIPVLPRPDAV
ncbi:hypothetical protein DL89DRAFT_323882 [Linderina pennispora]|uniref:Uncharacterized protein n=1 Tax=Linderina pennispora TaxID=61395 RepID=A0A1Y1W4S0_9FUNG|nr:uncharacterized protein DL89DRAFT_323882 [Linderina pennispora]ORX68345.1 hypothetical protein DL89DRAFT_323882 [Linderina pennispora]